MSLSGSPLTRLRWAFIALGAALLLAVTGLVASAVLRLDEQRRLRQLMVAERVFDEVERELGSLLQHEVERPSAAYDTIETDPSRWSPFVVGYYHRDPELHVIADAQLGEQRASRLRGAVARALPTLDTTQVAPAPIPNAAQDDRNLSAQSSSPDVLRQLNRSVKVRERRQHDLTESLIVRPVDRTTIVIERQAHDGSRREGFVIDVPVLISTLQSWVLTAQGLGAVATLDSVPRTLSETHSYYQFSHVLAAPLDSQSISLRLARFDDADAGTTLYGLALLFAATAVFGLIAVYRMVAVRIAFAERQSNFVSAVTHELKTPLTSVRMYADMLRDDMVPSEAAKREYYATISAEGERLTRLIDNVLEHAELRSGRRRRHIVSGDVGALAHEVVEVMTPHIEREGFAIELVVEPALPAVLLDADAFKQVLFNLLDNALKYGRAEPAAAIRIECLRAEQGVLLRVRDFGPGVGSDQLAMIFEPFFRGQDELTRRQKGTGIGLALVRDLVALMNGQVHAQNCTPGLEVSVTLHAA